MARNFITNAKEQSLKNRIRTLIEYSRELKFLVGFFYFSGWQELYEAIKRRAQEDPNFTIKILVGLDTDAPRGEVIEIADPSLSYATQIEAVGRFYKSLSIALSDEKLDEEEFHEQVSFFLKLLAEGRLQIRKTFEPNHAKLYLFCLDEHGQRVVGGPGRFITGSSNLTRAGLLSQHEFNIELGDFGWQDAETYFDELWESAIPLSELPERREQIIRIIRRKTQAAEITPFEAYALVLKHYIELMEQKALRPQVKTLMQKRGYRVYRYQEEAVQQALKVLDEYGGVILADVVGLGKSIIACWLAREKGGRGIVICPPALRGDPKTKSTGWHKFLSDFGLHDWEVFTVGELDKAQEYLANYGDDISLIIVDEAHRFRNEDTEAYERLSQICANRSVILLTATPFSNTPSDIFALLKLFVPPGKSTLTLDEKLAEQFERYNSEFRKLSYIMRYHEAGGEKRQRAERYYQQLFGTSLPADISRVQRRVQKLADEIRSVIEPVVIRRNRLDLKRDPVYSQEVAELSEVEDPIELFYELTPEQSRFYDRVICDYFGEGGGFRGAIYQPYFYEKRRQITRMEEEFTYQQQYNLFEFMRRLLVKRFESSFGAFAQSIENFIRIHEAVLQFIDKTGKYVLDRKLVERIWAEDEESIEAALQSFTEKLASKPKPNPRHDYIYELDKFDDKEGFLEDIRADLKLFRKIKDEVERLGLVKRDPKRQCLVKAINSILEIEPERKVVVFTEYRDTVQHISPALERAFGGRVLVSEGKLSKNFLDELLTNFDAACPKERWRDDYDVLVTTDRLSEGINLNRAGAIINYDIPWNPTRVIQRLGRINRIGQKVFDKLYIYNFFPTERGAEVVKNREIAAQKMFLIHNTLGEDAKIFAPDEMPSPAELFKRINRNPEEIEEESLLTAIRREFFAIKERHPDLVEGLNDFPPRVKTAKEAGQNELLVFRRKGLRLFVHIVPDTSAKKPSVRAITLKEALPHIRCRPQTPRLPLSPRFWTSYRAIKRHRERARPRSESSLPVRAENNLRSALEKYASELQDLLPFVRTLLRDIKEFQTLPKYTLRRLTMVEITDNVSPEELQLFREEIETLRRALGEDYLERIEKRIKDFKSEIIIAIENVLK